MKYFSLLIFVFFSWLQIGHTQAPTPQECSVQISATTQVSPPQIIRLVTLYLDGLQRTNLQLTANNNSINLSWSNPSETNMVGYNIYQASDIDGVFTKINSTPINGNTFVDNAPLSGRNVYQVKTVKKETSGSGTYQTLGTVQ